MENFIERDGVEVFQEEFLDFAGYNLQRRALPDARDGLKWGARKLIHAQMLGKLTYDKPFKKAIKSVSQAMSFSYTHGDASAYSTFIRMAKPFAYRVPLQEARGNYGTLINPDDHSASRYVELRGSEASAQLLKDLDKNTITEWEDTYDMEGQFPKVLPAKGFWNGVNGCISIGSGMSSSLPPLNLREVNEAMIKLLWNPEISEDEILCMPDFPTGATIYNAEKVKESLKNGRGPACKIRATIEWDGNERCFVVKEMPYSTYTNTICKELAVLQDGIGEQYIREIADYTKTTPDLRIYLTKNANPTKVLKMLFKETSLQTFFAINMTVLDKGITPVVMGQKALFSAHLEHEKIVYRRGFEYDLSKIRHRLHIIAGLISAIDAIDEVIHTIKTSASTAAASIALQKLLSIDEEQAKAILDIKLARLAKLEISKLEDEQAKLQSQAEHIEKILNDQTLFYKEIEKGLREVADKFGDDRRTKILNIEEDENGEDKEPLEKKELMVYLTNKGNLYVNETITYIIQKRGGRGAKIKLPKDEFITDSFSGENANNILLFSNKGKVYTTLLNNVPLNTLTSPAVLFNLSADELITNIISFEKNSSEKYIIFTTKNGLVKKSEISEYVQKRGKDNGMMGIKLKDGDEVINISFTTFDNLGILTEDGNCVIINTEKINAIGRLTTGVQGIKLNTGDKVIDAHLIPKNTKEILSISQKGLSKRTVISEFGENTRATKGNIIQKLKDGDKMASFLPLTDETEIAVISAGGTIKIPVSSIPCLSRQTIGVQAKKSENDKVIRIITIKN